MEINLSVGRRKKLISAARKIYASSPSNPSVLKWRLAALWTEAILGQPTFDPDKILTALLGKSSPADESEPPADLVPMVGRN